MTASGGTRGRLRRARSALLGTRSRVLGFLARAAAIRVTPRFRGVHWLAAVAVLLLILQMITGILLSLYYYPEPTAAYDSVRFLMSDVSIGWLIRSIHHWAAELLVSVVMAHVLVVFLAGAYRRPREYVWMLGVLLLCTVIFSRFTGRLLPWDTIGLATTAQGLELIESVPVVGRLTATWLRGGEAVGGNTLSRFFTTHVIVLPWLAAGLLAAHAWLVRAHGLKGDDQ
jgi:menaquinol-cytochrome c reductase cytochrome b subunit